MPRRSDVLLVRVLVEIPLGNAGLQEGVADDGCFLDMEGGFLVGHRQGIHLHADDFIENGDCHEGRQDDDADADDLGPDTPADHGAPLELSLTHD